MNMFQRLRNSEKQKIQKENDGQSARKRKQRRFIMYLLCILIVYVMTTTLYYRHFAGVFVPDIEIDPITGDAKIRRRPERHYTKMDPKQKTTPIDAVLEGFLTLIDIKIGQSSLQAGTGNKNYDNIIGTFCHIDWELQQRNPAIVPMFKDLKGQSEMCQGTIFSTDLRTVVEKVKIFDSKFGINATIRTGKRDVVLPIPEPTGVVFHETRCGSTLTANLLASFAPEHSRVYSESPPPVTALRACENGIPCDPIKHTTLIRDVFYLMGRTTRIDRPQFVFYKIQSIGVTAIDKFTMAFPNTPWVFLYRDSIEVMMSHFKSGIVKNPTSHSDRLPVCGRNYWKRMDQQPRTVQQVLMQHGDTVTHDLDIENFCAAHLAGLSLSALNEHDRTGMGNFVNYNQLPEIGWTKILPKFFNVKPMTGAMIANMKQVAGVYSKGRGKTANKEWEEDSTKKQTLAPPQVIKAADTYMKDIYDRMEKLSLES